MFQSLPSLESIKVKPSMMLLGLGGVVLVAYAVTGASYLRERSEQPRLTEQVTAGGALLSNLGDSQQTLADLKERLAQLQASVTSYSGALPTKLESASLVQGLLAHAAQQNVRITQMTGLPPKEVKGTAEDGPTYQTVSYGVVADGALLNLLALLSLIEGDTTQTVGIGDVTLAPTEDRYEMKFTAAFYASSENAGAASTPSATGAAQPTPKAAGGGQANPSGG